MQFYSVKYIYNIYINSNVVNLYIGIFIENFKTNEISYNTGLIKFIYNIFRYNMYLFRTANIYLSKFNIDVLDIKYKL